MKKLVLATLLATLALPAFADDIYGVWKTLPDDNNKFGHIQIGPCGAKICGKLIRSFDEEGEEYAGKSVGKNLIWDMVNEGGGKYSGGKVYSPDRDKTYNGKLVLKGNSLDVKGCIAFICRSGGSWTRVK